MKKTILSLLKKGGPVSGETLAGQLGVSRTAVWKSVKRLRDEGYGIESSPRRGYTLVSVPDRLLVEEIYDGLATCVLGREMLVFGELPSTQDYAKHLAQNGCPEGTTVIAERQTCGRGRLGRKWESPPGGLYFSIVLRPPLSLLEATRIPLVAGVVLARALEQYAAVQPRLKWPNDILIAGRKAAGILSEMSAEMELLHWVVLGIGINIDAKPSDFPKEIGSIATSLRPGESDAVDRVRLFQDILFQLEDSLARFQVEGFEPFLMLWTEMNDTLGRDVRIADGREMIEGRALEIDADGALVLECRDGSKRRVTTGEVFFNE